MIVPSSACPASCRYCFGPHDGCGVMSIDVVKDIIDWQRDRPGRLEVSFHGGEPLTAGVDFFQEAIPLLEKGLSHRDVKFSIQSNLWLLTEELCHTFRDHHVSIGTSLDGPENITDAQRVIGYFRRTMKGIEMARRNGLDVGCICTFTPRSLPLLDEVFRFFMEQGLSYTIHACMPSLQYSSAESWSLSADEHYQLLTRALDLYLKNLDSIVIGTFDSMCRSVSTRQGSICTFTDCLGHHLAVGPGGGIFPCQRFVGLAEYSMGNVRTHIYDAIHSSPVWRSFQGRQERMKDECGDCPYIEICHGGCPYNALASNGGTFERSSKDPHCSAYRRMFQHISERALEEVFSSENMEEVITRPDHRNDLLRRGKLISIMRDGPHPYYAARHARLILASVALASGDPPHIATEKLRRIGVLPQGRGSEEAVIESDRLKDLGKHTVNTNRQCRKCELRFLCGGACRAWSQRSTDVLEDLDQPPGDCTTLHHRARSLFLSALERLNVTEHEWGSAGLPVPKPSRPPSSES
jgi:uncharacterized protein